MNQPQVSHHQTRFDKGLNRQYSPPNSVNYHQSPLGSIPGQDLSASLMELANIQSGSFGNDGCQPKEPTRGIPQANKSQ